MNYAKFHKEWIVTGIAVIVKGRVRTQVLANWQQETQVDPQKPILVFATDGSGLKGQAGWGYVSMRTTNTAMLTDTAGFRDSDAVTEEAGRVVLNRKLPEYIGATQATNNTGELTGVHMALTRAEECLRAGEDLLILSDSQLAICTTVGAWAPRRNRALVMRNRDALARLRALGVVVRLRHVRAHRGHGMNERADALANQGAQGMCVRDGKPYDPPVGDESSPPPPTHP